MKCNSSKKLGEMSCTDHFIKKLQGLILVETVWKLFVDIDPINIKKEKSDTCT